jgi:hypothetical protein
MRVRRFLWTSIVADLSVFVFQWEETDLHALTLYSAGDNLPTHLCDGSWRYRGRLLLNSQSLATLPLNVAAATAELRAHGLFVARFSSRIIMLSW